MINISQSFCLPTIFIRYNPDYYYNTLKNGNKKKMEPSKNKRMDTLKRWLNYVLNLNYQELKKIGYCSMVQLYYNNFNSSNTEFITITKFD